MYACRRGTRSAGAPPAGPGAPRPPPPPPPEEREPFLRSGGRRLGGPGYRRPHADQRLIEAILVVPIGRRLAVDNRALAAIDAHPARHVAAPLVGYLREHVDAGTYVFAELRVVRRGREHLVRPLALPELIQLVKLARRDSEPRRIASDLIQRQQQIEPVERRVLQALRLQRTGVLLEFHRKAQPLG